MNLRTVACLVLSAFSLLAAESATTPAVATIDGVPLTLRQLEDAMLKREGNDLIEEWVHRQLGAMDVTTLRDDDVILTIGFNKVTRREIADALLRKGAAKVRDELINIRLVEQAVARDGVIVGPVELEATWERMRRTFEEGPGKQGDTRIDFVNWLQIQQKMTPEQFRAQPGFRLMAGLHALVHHRAAGEWSDPELRQWFTANADRWRQREAVDLMVLAIPWQAEPGPDGRPQVTAAERERLASVFASIRDEIVRGAQTLPRAWQFYASSYDRAAKGGHVGWVERDGGRADGGRRIAVATIEAAWAARTFPTLLQPVASDWGIELAEVRAHRPPREPVYEELRDQVRAARVDQELDKRTDALLLELRRAAKIEYASLPAIIDGRR